MEADAVSEASGRAVDGPFLRCYTPNSPSIRDRVGANVRFPIAVGFSPRAGHFFGPARADGDYGGAPGD